MLIDQLQADLVAAMKAGNVATRDAIRSVKTALKNEEVSRQHPLGEDEALVVLAKLVKQLTEAATEFRSYGDSTRAAAETERAELLKRYLPTPLTEAEVATIVGRTIAETGARSPADMGRVMQAIKPQIGTRADGAAVAALVRGKLAAS